MENLLSQLQVCRQPAVGIGVTAFTRIGPAFLLPNYSALCLLETTDLNAIRQLCSVYSLERDLGINPDELERQNTASILKQAKVKQFFRSLGSEVGLLVYKSSPKVEAICSQLGIKILSNPARVRDPFEDKKQFRRLAELAGVRLIPGETLLIDQLSILKHQQLTAQYGPKLVWQLPDYKIGGGIGTMFISSPADYRQAMAFIQRRRKSGKKLRWVNVTRFISGIDASIAACVTRHGVVCGLVQTQLNDIAEATAFKGRNGVWCGHDWSWKHFDSKIQEKAESIAKKLGQYMFKKGYRGMFGLDLMIDADDQVWPVECNARYTAAFPVYCMIQRLYKEIPFDALHLAEHLDINYQIDLDKLQQLYRRPKTGAQLVMRNQTRKTVMVKGAVKGGVYQFKQGKLVWRRPGFSLQDLRTRDELCLVDRAAIQGRILKPGERLVRVLFKDKIAVSSNQLTDWASQACQAVYRKYNLKTSTPGVS